MHVVSVGAVGMREAARARTHLTQQMETTYGRANFMVDDIALDGPPAPGVCLVYILPGGAERAGPAIKLFEEHKVIVNVADRRTIARAFETSSPTFGGTLASVSVVAYDKAARFGAEGVANVVIHEAGHALSHLEVGKDHEFGGIMAATPTNLASLQDWPDGFVQSLKAGR